MSEGREAKINNLRAIIIFLIVFTNCIFSFHLRNSLIVTNIVRFIYSFLMPVFCIISGYQSRKGCDSKQLVRLFGLFMVMNLSFYWYEYIVTGAIDGTIIKYSSWYIIDLIVWRLLYKQIRNKKMAFLLCLVIIWLLTVIPNNLDMLNVDMLIFYFSFFLLGSFDIFEDSKNKKEAIGKLVLCFLCIIVCMKVFKYDWDFLNRLYHRNSWLVFVRIILYGCVYAITKSAYVLMPDREIKGISSMGKDSLSIYFFHNLLAMIFSDLVHDNHLIIIWGLFYTYFLCLLFGNSYINKLLKFIMDCFLKWYSWIGLMVVIVISILVYAFSGKSAVINDEMGIYNVLSNDNVEDIKERSIEIGTIGDLILLEEQIKDSYNMGKYNFDYMFKYMGDYFKDIDYLMVNVRGVSDDEQLYTPENKMKDDLKINVPSEIFSSLNKYNFKLVNIGNPKMLDYGEDSLFKTIDNIEKNKLAYVGAFKEKDEMPKIVDVEGIKMGILSYSFAPMSMDENELYYDYSYVNRFLCSEGSRRFDRTKEQVKKDFKYLKDEGVDIIVVMPSSGTNNSKEMESKQQVWNKIFGEYGADIVIGNYSTNTQLIEYYDEMVIINSSGSFINIKDHEDSDLSVMTKIYVDKEKKKVNGISIVPIYSLKDKENGYVGLPIYKGLNDEEIYSTLGQTDIDRMRKGVEIITKTMFKREISVIEDEYFYFIDGYKRQEVKGLEISKDEEKSDIYKVMSKSKNTCYVGDYYTTGSNNGGFGWFEPLVSTFKNNKVVIGNDDLTSEDAALNYYDEMHNSNCDLFVVAIGSNDIRKKNVNVDSYIDNMGKLLKNVNKDIVVIAPWQPLEVNYDRISDYIQDMERFEVYNKRLKDFSRENGYLFVNPNNYIKGILKTNYVELYYNEEYYVNANKGLELFSRSIFY